MRIVDANEFKEFSSKEKNRRYDNLLIKFNALMMKAEKLEVENISLNAQIAEYKRSEILNQENLEDLLSSMSAVRAIAEKMNEGSPEREDIIYFDMFSFCRNTKSIIYNDKTIALSGQDYIVLNKLIIGHGDIVAIDELSQPAISQVIHRLKKKADFLEISTFRGKGLKLENKKKDWNSGIVRG